MMSHVKNKIIQPNHIEYNNQETSNTLKIWEVKIDSFKKMTTTIIISEDSNI